jgi:predicted RNA binding protein YcfA (HicA-like mRNA interferase family)
VFGSILGWVATIPDRGTFTLRGCGVGRLADHKPRKVLRAFKHFGWERDRTTSSHHILKKEGHRDIISIPYHGGKSVKEGLLRDQLRVAGIDTDEFLEQL